MCSHRQVENSFFGVFPVPYTGSIEDKQCAGQLSGSSVSFSMGDSPHQARDSRVIPVTLQKNVGSRLSYETMLVTDARRKGVLAATLKPTDYSICTCSTICQCLAYFNQIILPHIRRAGKSTAMIESLKETKTLHTDMQPKIMLY